MRAAPRAPIRRLAASSSAAMACASSPRPRHTDGRSAPDLHSPDGLGYHPIVVRLYELYLDGQPGLVDEPYSAARPFHRLHYCLLVKKKLLHTMREAFFFITLIVQD